MHPRRRTSTPGLCNHMRQRMWAQRCSRVRTLYGRSAEGRGLKKREPMGGADLISRLVGYQASPAILPDRTVATSAEDPRHARVQVPVTPAGPVQGQHASKCLALRTAGLFCSLMHSCPSGQEPAHITEGRSLCLCANQKLMYKYHVTGDAPLLGDPLVAEM